MLAFSSFFVGETFAYTEICQSVDFFRFTSVPVLFPSVLLNNIFIDLFLMREELTEVFGKKC
jgi:hypothetical protein